MLDVMRRNPLAVAAVAGLLASAVVIVLIQRYLEKDGRAQMFAALVTLKSNLSVETVRAKGMGVAAMMGLTDPVLKAAALGKYAYDAPEVLSRLAIPRRYFNYEGIYVVDKDGVMVDNDTDGKKSTGKSIGFRPYFQQAIRGQESVYVAVGTNSESRGIFYAAPLYDGADRSGRIIGVVSIKTAAEPLDDILRHAGGDGMLLSPQGVVFASTRPEWLFAITPPFDRQRVEDIGKLKQFGMYFENRIPAVLPFDPAGKKIVLDGETHAVERIPLDMRDPGGNWMLVRFQPVAQWFPPLAKGTIIAVILLASLTMGFYYRRHRVFRLEAAARLWEERTEREQTERLLLEEAQLRTRIAETGMQLRSSASVEELSLHLMSALAAMLGMRYGLLYIADEHARRLTLCGGYGVGTEKMGTTVGYGEGLAGQCAIERKAILLEALPEAYWRVRSGTGSAAPKAVLLRPILRNDRLLGVLEVALLRLPDRHDESVLDELSAMVSLNIEILLRNRATAGSMAEAA